MSTADTYMNWGASYCVNDFYKRFIRKKAEEKPSAAELEKERIITEQQLSLAKARENEVAWNECL